MVIHEIIIFSLSSLRVDIVINTIMIMPYQGLDNTL